jgi:FKBP12-rapamycin complex-associated protein
METMQALLNLAEFMEHDDKILPIPMRVLGGYAMRCHAFAKALHYKELEGLADLQPEVRGPGLDSDDSAGRSEQILESLVSINQQLQQPDTAEGILIYAQKCFDMGFHEEWYEKLEKWDEALGAYTRRCDEDPGNIDLVFGRMTCLHALGEWEDLSQLAEEHWPHVALDMRRKMAPLAAAASWGMAEWEAMDDYISVMKHDSADRAWFRAVLNVHRGQVVKATQHISKARDLLDGELTTLIGESYTRAYKCALLRVCRGSTLTRLPSQPSRSSPDACRARGDHPVQGVVQGRQRESRPTCRHSEDVDEEVRLGASADYVKLTSAHCRLRGCQRDVEVWQRVLKVRALVMSPCENVEMWIKFANLCRKSGRLGLAEKTINSLLGEIHADVEDAVSSICS